MIRRESDGGQAGVGSPVRAVLGVLILVWLGQSARAADLLVPSQYPTVMAAIEAAASGDAVVISPGVYPIDGSFNQVQYRDREITIRAEFVADPPTLQSSTALGGSGGLFMAHRSVTLSHLTFDVDPANPGIGLVSIVGQGGSDVERIVVSNCDFTHDVPRDDGSANYVCSFQAYDVDVDSSTISAADGRLVQIRATRSPTGSVAIQDCTIDVIDSASVYIADSLVISDSQFSCRDVPIAIENATGSGSTLIERCSFSDADNSLLVIRGDTTFIDCVFQRATGHDFVIRQNHTDSYTYRYQGCTFEDLDSSAFGQGVGLIEHFSPLVFGNPTYTIEIVDSHFSQCATPVVGGMRAVEGSVFDVSGMTFTGNAGPSSLETVLMLDAEINRVSDMVISNMVGGFSAPLLNSREVSQNGQIREVTIENLHVHDVDPMSYAVSVTEESGGAGPVEPSIVTNISNVLLERVAARGALSIESRWGTASWDSIDGIPATVSGVQVVDSTSQSGTAFVLTGRVDDGQEPIVQHSADGVFVCGPNWRIEGSPGVFNLTNALDLDTCTDCDGDGTIDYFNINDAGGFNGLGGDLDCNGNGLIDSCEIDDAGGAMGVGGSLDCDGNGRLDFCDINDQGGVNGRGGLLDCDQNAEIDECQINSDGGINGLGGALDCNENGALDSCDLDLPELFDCDENGLIDNCEIADNGGPGGDLDCDGDWMLDCCQIRDNGGDLNSCSGGDSDRNANGRLDFCDINDDGGMDGLGGSSDCDLDGVLDAWEIDDAGGENGVGGPLDLNMNGVLDFCDIRDGTSQDCDTNGEPDEVQADCTGNGIPDVCDIRDDPDVYDCNSNGIPDGLCEDLELTPFEDCNGDGVEDACQIALNPGLDCDGNGVLDICDLFTPVLEVVFVIDNSNSDTDEVQLISDAITGVEQQLTDAMVTVSTRTLGVLDTINPNFDGVIAPGDYVESLYGAIVPGMPPCCNLISTEESYASAAAQVAQNFPWMTQRNRVIVTFGDEAPFEGSPCDDPGDDRDVVTGTVQVTNASEAVLVPVLTTGFSPCDQGLAQAMADGTGGEAFDSDQAGPPLVDRLSAFLIDLATGADEDLDERLDECQIADDPSLDCDENGRLDLIERNEDNLLDCDGSNLLDVCQFPRVELGTGEVSPLIAGSPITVLIPLAPQTGSDVLVDLRASADLSAEDEFVTVRINGFDLGTAFDSGAFDCPFTADRAQVVISPVFFNAFATGGDVLIEVVPSDQVDGLICAESFLEANVSYQPIVNGDLNGNGIPDGCSLDEGDCDGNGVFDLLEIFNDPSLDCEPNGTLDICQVPGQVISGDKGGPIFSGEPLEFGIEDAPIATTDVIIDVTLLGDFGEANEFAVLRLNGAEIARFLDGTSDPANQCPAMPIELTVTLTADEFNTLVIAGVASFELVATTAVSFPECPFGEASVTARYFYEVDGIDCNGNGVPDECDIVNGTSLDDNINTIPDECERCLADLAEPFDVLDLADIVAFVTAFGAEDPAADFDMNGIFDLGDIVAFVQAFNAGCP